MDRELLVALFRKAERLWAESFDVRIRALWQYGGQIFTAVFFFLEAEESSPVFHLLFCCCLSSQTPS